MFALDVKTAIVTGATGGLGSAMALALAKAGAAIVSIELPDDPLSSALKEALEHIPVSLHTFRCDLRDSASLRDCYRRIWDAGIVPDILVNCAGVVRRTPCEDTCDEDIDLVLNVNVKACYVSTQEFGRRLIYQGRPGKIINISSVTSYQAGFNTSIYSTSKGAVMQMTKAFSNEWASKGIQVNSIAPDFMDTTMTSGYQADPEIIQYLMSRVPMKRWGSPDDLQSAVLFLASPANRFVSGITLPVDGGFLGK
ncbi:uncharacterized protein NECHADRAFT_55852 [Fusarium vanettenii 77-13-4]|uniref:2-deoxy-D-gluconate 3-dehydrogenase n=1 Tax=Fusarium vanettenii (strain ATCC MYA-4622 / CBS 123669 / FGSC 9596 / NRRL 45880 / 77-13-4) TaxID=660122 RepID=C7ZPY0_FUSV7|nr:uncharacterized protein NECHADRAFT_55852 [Fusarium vanettenii 77-13-4]EEU33921.1 hypothetical protein NECHADRAFT_55852 [Fusarium vanettenii 77-13-4]